MSNVLHAGLVWFGMTRQTLPHVSFIILPSENLLFLAGIQQLVSFHVQSLTRLWPLPSDSNESPSPQRPVTAPLVQGRREPQRSAGKHSRGAPLLRKFLNFLMAHSDGVFYYLCRGGYVFARLCLFVCLSVCQQDSSKSYVQIFLTFSGNVGNGKNYQWFNFWGIQKKSWILDHFEIFVNIANRIWCCHLANNMALAEVCGLWLLSSFILSDGGGTKRRRAQSDFSPLDGPALSHAPPSSCVSIPHFWLSEVPAFCFVVRCGYKCVYACMYIHLLAMVTIHAKHCTITETITKGMAGHNDTYSRP